MKRKNWVTIIILSLIVGIALKAKPKTISKDCPLQARNVSKDKPDDEKKRYVLEIQSQNILAIFLISVIVPFCIILWLGIALSETSYLVVNFVNLIFKSLSIMITVFIPAILVDSEIVNFKLKKFTYSSAIVTFYFILVFGNIRYWLKELYPQQYQLDFFIKHVNNLEIFIGIVSVACLFISAISTLIPSKVQKSSHL